MLLAMLVCAQPLPALGTLAQGAVCTMQGGYTVALAQLANTPHIGEVLLLLCTFNQTHPVSRLHFYYSRKMSVQFPSRVLG